MQTPLWTLLFGIAVGLVAAVVGPLPSTIMTNRQRNEEMKQQNEQEHRVWFRQKRVDAYEQVLDWLQRYLQSRRGQPSSGDGKAERLKEMSDFYIQVPQMLALSEVYASLTIKPTIEHTVKVYTRLADADIAQLNTGQQIPSNAVEDYGKQYILLANAVRHELWES